MDKPNHFIIVPHRSHYVLVNTKGDRSHHTHLESKKTCRNLVGMVCNKTVPTSNYLKESAKRVSRDKKYILEVEIKQSKDKEKPKFRRVQRSRVSLVR